MPHGGLTVLREVEYDPRTQGLVANPVAELASLRNASLVSELDVTVGAGTPSHLLKGTEGGRALSADIELQWSLPSASQASATFGALLLSAPTSPAAGSNISSGVSVSVSVAAAAAADGSRAAELTVGHGAYAMPGRAHVLGVQARQTFTVLKSETTLAMRLLVDRIIVEAFIQDGRVAYTRSFIPAQWDHSAVHLFAKTAVQRARPRGCGRWDAAGSATSPQVADEEWR